MYAAEVRARKNPSDAVGVIQQQPVAPRRPGLPTVFVPQLTGGSPELPIDVVAFREVSRATGAPVNSFATMFGSTCSSPLN
jgi:hypothetical protein